MHPGVDLDCVRAATGWDLDVADNLAVTRPPSESELVALRRLQQARG
jgi:glutaconate CoA-transferase subunit B